MKVHVAEHLHRGPHVEAVVERGVAKVVVPRKEKKCLNIFFGLVWFWFGFIAGPCEKERLKAQYTVHQTNSMADSLTVGLTPC